ncbi:MAG TPA: hypothetical protein DCS21_00525 [Gammaproteobacteria bacterium]|nr:hypothetical protein [Gammaproteobacteria bacterium]
MSVKDIEEVLRQVEVGPSLQFKNVTMFPLLAADLGIPDYLTLDEGLAQGQVQITEISDAGSVPELRLVNRGQQPVCGFSDQELVGAKQNRILNLTILAPALSTIIIPVSCVEAGRWHRSSREFSSQGRVFYAEGRSRKASQVTDSLRARGIRSSEQSAVWANIAEKGRRMGSHSDTGAMAQMFDDYQGMIESYVSAIKAVENQVGAVFVIGGRIRSIELFDFAETLEKLLPKLVASHALDAIDEGDALDDQEDNASALLPEVKHFLATVAAAEGSVHPAVGEGEDIRLSGLKLAGGGLRARGRIVHLCAFTLETDPRQVRPRSRYRKQRDQDHGFNPPSGGEQRE